MSFHSLNQFIERLEEDDELVRVTQKVNPALEITEITDRVSKQSDGGKALLFENTGTRFPILMNAMGSEKRMELALGVNNLDDIGKELERLYVDFSSLSGFIYSSSIKMLARGWWAVCYFANGYY